MLRCIPIFAVIALTGGCATIPRPLQGEFATTSPAQAPSVGSAVRWGGEIIDVRPRADATCFEVLSRELGESARPRGGDISAGRFLACRAGFYDPAIFRQGRELTITGRIDGSEETLVGEYRYRLPRIAADVIYLWPERAVERNRYFFPYDPFWPYSYYGPFGPTIRWHRVPRSALTTTETKPPPASADAP